MADDITTIRRAAVEQAYRAMFAKYTERFPYNPHKRVGNTALAVSGGYSNALEDLAMIAFGLNSEESAQRVAEDYADYVASLG